MTIYSSPRLWLARCAVAASAFTLAACTASSGSDGSAIGSSPSAPNTSQTATQPSDKKLTEQAQAALAAVHSGTLVEAGAERVTDGIHTEPTLSEGKTYKLNLACVGSGSAQLSFAPASAGTKITVPCDQSVVQQRITGKKAVRINVDAAKGATGVIAWQIDAV